MDRPQACALNDNNISTPARVQCWSPTPDSRPRAAPSLGRLTGGDLQPEFQAALEADLAADPLLGGEYPDQPD
jgi:hypothetical protein